MVFNDIVKTLRWEHALLEVAGGLIQLESMRSDENIKRYVWNNWGAERHGVLEPCRPF